MSDIPDTETPIVEESMGHRIASLKYNLTSTDWVVVKIMEVETEEERVQLRQKYADIISQRRLWREQINELEQDIPSEDMSDIDTVSETEDVLKEETEGDLTEESPNTESEEGN